MTPNMPTTPGISGWTNLGFSGPSGPTNSVQGPDEVIRTIRKGLLDYSGNGGPHDGDQIFGLHAWLIGEFLRYGNGDLWKLAHLWPDIIEPEVNAWEKEHGQRIHKGAPIYNTGLAYFLLGDFDSAFRYLVEASKEDEQSQRGNWVGIIFGRTGLYEQILWKPIESELCPLWVSDYAKITGRGLDTEEISGLLQILAGRPADGIQAVFAMHRLRNARAYPENDGSKLIRFRALADLVHLIESFLRQFQKTGQSLNPLLNELLGPNKSAQDSYNTFKKDYLKAWKNHSAESMDWLVEQTITRIDTISSPASASGLVIYFCHQLRNCLLHVNEDSITLFENASQCIKAAGWVIGVLRICTMKKEGTFANLK